MKPIRATVAAVFIAQFATCLSLFAEDMTATGQPERGAAAPEKTLMHPCPVSFVLKTRTARTVGKGHLSLSLLGQPIDYDEVKGADGTYRDLAPGDRYERWRSVFVVKYGWAKYHHLALGIPYFWNDINLTGQVTDNDGLGNVFLFEKWNCIQESQYVPAVSLDAWYLSPTGDTDRKHGSSDSAGRVTAAISKTWKAFSLHLNPGYTFRKGSDTTEVNAGLLLTPTKTFWPLLEYNFSSLSGGGDSHNLLPGIMWKPFPGGNLRLGPLINLDSSLKYREKLGFAAKFSYRF